MPLEAWLKCYALVCRYVATTLNKVELIHSVLRLGYSPFWVDTDVVHFGNALPYLHTLDADMAIGCEFCHSWSNLSAGAFVHTGMSGAVCTS